MESLLFAIDSLSSVNPLLVPISKFSIFLLICLFAFVPISILSFLILKAFEKHLNNLRDFFIGVANKLDYLSKRILVRAKIDLDRFYSAYSSMIPLDIPKISITNIALQDKLDKFERELERAPELAIDREANKTQLVEQLNTTLNDLENGSTSLKKIEIPALVLDPEHALRKRSARSSLMIFTPLLIAVILVNTILLNTFFEELLYGMEIFSIPYSIVIALMFTLIEMGVGVVFGFQEREIERGERQAGNYITFAFGWLIIIGLALVEWFLYLLVGTHTSYNFDDPTLIAEALIDGQYLELFLEGGWLSLLGPTIVLGLYIFGHRVSTAYYDFVKDSDLERLKKDLDDRFELFSNLSAGINEFSDKIVMLLSKIREENTQLNKIKAASSTNLDEFRSIFRNNRDEILETISKAEDVKIPIPEIQRISLNREDTVSFHRANLIYLFIAIASFIVLALSLKTDYGLKLPLDLQGSLQFFVSLILCGLGITSGISLSSNVSVVQTSDGKVARVIIERISLLRLLGGIFVGSLAIFLLFLLNDGKSILHNPTQFILGLLCLIGTFIAGKHLLGSISGWRAFISYGSSRINVGLLQIGALIFRVLAVFASTLNPLLDGLSFPIKTIIRGNKQL